jgi:hypothetical protein
MCIDFGLQDGLRACQSRASSWTLFATAVRIATALGLGEEDAEKYTPLDLEVRRRVWYLIGVMDSQTALDRGTVPILPSKKFNAPPLDINDSDISSGMEPLTPAPGMTDMSISMIAQEAMVCHKKLCDPPREGQDKMEHWKYKLNLVKTLEQSWQAKYATINENASPIQKFAKFVTEDIATDINLQLRRPPFKQEWGYVPPNDDFSILETATTVLEQTMRIKAREFAPWAWKSWVKWYALALVLAELCSEPEETLASRAYAAAQKSFRSYAPLIADSKSGMLWKPIVKLMRRVEHIRSSPFVPESFTLSETRPIGGLGLIQSDVCDISSALPDQLAAMYPSPTGIPPDPTSHIDLNSTEYSMSSGGNMYIIDGAETDPAWYNWNLFLDDVNNPSNYLQSMDMNFWTNDNYNMIP